MQDSANDRTRRHDVAADHSTPAFHRTGRSRVGAARRPGDRRQRRLLRAEGEPRSSREPPIFIPGKFTSRGKWMDGWESRRRRTPGHDWCVVGLGMRGVVRGVDVDTSFFTGNYPSHCSIDALAANARRRAGARGQRRRAVDRSLLRKSPLTGNSHNYFHRRRPRPWTHLRLNIFPDGGVARLRVYGDVVVDWARDRRRAGAASISRRSPTAAWCSARATCTSAPRTT